MWVWIETAKNGLSQGIEIGLMAIAFRMVYAATDIFHIAVGIPFLVGGYVALLCLNAFALPEPFVIIAAILAGVITSQLIHGFAYAPLLVRNASASLRLVSSIGAMYLAIGLASLLIGQSVVFPQVFDSSSWVFRKVIISHEDVRYAVMGLVVLLCLGVLSHRAKWGLLVAAYIGNPLLYASLGRDPRPLIWGSVSISGGIGGLCGSFEGLRNGIDPNIALPIAVAGAVAAILGGRSLVVGPALGGATLGLIRSVVSQVFSDVWTDTFTYAAMLIIILAGPRRFWASSREDLRL